MSLFDAVDFYPTPIELIRKMVEPYRQKINKGGLCILDPECGEGAIIKYLTDMHTYSSSRGKNQFYAFELNDELAMIAGNIERLKILGKDFLEYYGNVYFNLIIMNPPFSKGAEHLLQAWKVLHEGDICCLLNEETVKNPNSTNKRILAEIIKENGSVEYIGAAFSTAARRTNVRVALVRLTKKAAVNPFEFEKVGLDGGGNKMQIDFEKLQNTAIATNNVIGNMELCFKELQSALIDLIKGLNKAQFYGNTLNFSVFQSLGEFCKSGAYGFKNGNEEFNPYALFNSISADANEKAWGIILNDTKFAQKLTSDFRKNFDKFRRAQGEVVFNKTNVIKMLEFMLENQGNIIQQCIVSVFEKLTKYSEKNVEKSLSWKTNSHYKLNKKFIMPALSDTFYSSLFTEWADDLDIACGHLTGEKAVDANGGKLSESVRWHKRNVPQYHKVAGESKFFTFRVYLKGTIHVEFKDNSLWEKFNITATKDKNWIADDLDKKKSKSK